MRLDSVLTNGELGLVFRLCDWLHACCAFAAFGLLGSAPSLITFSIQIHYPFKEQECHFNFFQDGEANYLMHFDLKEVKYDGPKRIGQFIVKKWTIQNSIDRTQVEKRFLK